MTQGKDLQDFQKSISLPTTAFMRKQSLPRTARRKRAEPTRYQSLKKFLSTDLVEWAREYFKYRIGRKHPFLYYNRPLLDNGIYPLQGDGGGEIRVAVAGDWGTGTDEAFRIAEIMAKSEPHYTIHLGDVYFVGDPAEVKENFLGIANPRHDYKPCQWPSGSLGSFALNGNHEMYARGYAYFTLILPRLGLTHKDGAHGQKASFFCLENEHWRIIGLDTGYRSIGIPILENIFSPDCALPDALVAWLRGFVQTSDRRGIVLMSHHQYYSRFDNWYTKAAEQLAEFIDRPVIWLWGHEHRLTVYKKFQTGKGIEAFGRCIGHGGMPVDLPPASAKHAECEVEFVDQRKYPNDEHLDVGINGFASLTFKGDTLKIDYVDIYSNVIFAETWQVDGAGRVAQVAAMAEPVSA